jgi:hypothetical protein
LDSGEPREQPDGAQQIQEELQVLRLPVLGDVDGERGGGEVVEVADGIGAATCWLLKSASPTTD